MYIEIEKELTRGEKGRRERVFERRAPEHGGWWCGVRREMKKRDQKTRSSLEGCMGMGAVAARLLTEK